MPVEAPPISYANIESAAQQLNGIANITPIFTSRTVDRLTRAQVFFKAESFQRTGSFKFRGAYNTLSRLSAAQRQLEIATISSGNHGQAIALSAQLLGLSATVLMPKEAPEVKKQAVRDYGARVQLCDYSQVTTAQLLQQIAENPQQLFVSSHDRAEIIAGQGTVAKELFESVGELDLLLVVCGGGGLLSGSAIVAKTLYPNCRVIGVEPERADDAKRSFYSKTLHTIPKPDTIADGARGVSLGQLTFPLILSHVDDMVTVSEDSIRRAMRFVWERLKLAIEPTGVVAAAALLDGIVSAPGQRVGVVLSGGNVDLQKLDRLLTVTGEGGDRVA